MSVHYEVAREATRLERVARKRGRASILRCALSRWKDGVTVQRTEREIEERIQEKKKEVDAWLAAIGTGS